MHEGLKNNFEDGHEHISSLDEIKEIFEKLLEIKDYEEVRKKEDEKGLYLWDIKVRGEDGDIEYSYMRKGVYNEG